MVGSAPGSAAHGATIVASAGGTGGAGSTDGATGSGAGTSGAAGGGASWGGASRLPHRTQNRCSGFATGAPHFGQLTETPSSTLDTRQQHSFSTSSRMSSTKGPETFSRTI